MGTKIKPKFEDKLKEELSEEHYKIFKEASERELGKIQVLKDFDLEEYEKSIEEPKSIDWFFDKDGTAHYHIEVDGKEATVDLYERYKGVIFTGHWEGDFYKTYYIGACRRGEEDNYIPFKEPFEMRGDDGGKSFQKAVELAEDLLK